MLSDSKDRPSAEDVVTRGVVLMHVFLKTLATPPADVLARFNQPPGNPEGLKLADDLRSMFAQQHEQKLRAAGLWELLEEEERAFLTAGAFETTMRQRIDGSWLAESIACLLWAVGHREAIPPYDQQTDPKTNKFAGGQGTRMLIAGAKLRPPSRIDRERDLAELWHWRCRTHRLLAEKRIPEVLPNGLTIAEVIRMSARKAAQEGLIAEPIEDDFPAFGKPFRTISEEEFSQCMSIAKERHKAFNWLCGYAPENRWSETPTDT
jgi:hypothetical protein